MGIVLKPKRKYKPKSTSMAYSSSTETDLVMSKEKTNKDKEVYFVLDNNDNCDYIINIKTKKNGDKVYKLFYSNAEVWNSHVKGSLRLTMTDVGDGMKFKFGDNINLSKIDYADLEILRILINLELKLENGHSNHRIVKCTEI